MSITHILKRARVAQWVR